MRYPEFLKEKGRIGFIAPSFGCATEPYSSRFDEAIRKFKNKGYSLVFGPNCRVSEGIGKSNTSIACAEEINDFFINDRSDIVMSCGGGELMCEDLPFVDFEKIKASKPKWYIGYSDNTNLTFLLPTICDIASIYGPCVSDFGMEPWHQSIEDSFSILIGKKLTVKNYDGWEKEWPERETNPIAPYNITEPYSHILISPNSKADFSGRLIGGCMDCLVTLCGTTFDRVRDFNEKYKEDGIIWFLESCDLNVMSMRRALWQFENAGWFEHVKGFIIGRPLHYDDDFDGFTPHEAFRGILEKYNVPIILDTDLGHLSPMMPLIVGSKASVEASSEEIKINMKLA